MTTRSHLSVRDDGTEDRARGVEAGFDAHIDKPIDVRALAKTIEAMRPC